MRTTTLRVMLVLAVAGAVIMAMGCPRDQDSGDDADNSLVVSTERPGTDEPSAEAVQGTEAEEAAHPGEPQEPAQAEPRAAEGEEEEEMAEETRVRIKTTQGDIVAQLYAEDAPKTVANFLALAEAGYYDDMVWHRVEPGFVIQIGDGPETANIPDEVNRHKHQPGALAMAKLGSPVPGRLSMPDSASSQFYIAMGTAERTEYLNAEYTVFGQVTEGMDVVTSITTDDKVKSVEVLSATG
jgi:peptidyl-prolyl cis-trans isomerase B (cyclophilin B)